MVKTKKGQAFIENIILWGIITFVVIGLLYYGLSYFHDNNRVNQANDVVKSLAITANTVHNLGRGSKQTIYVYVPEGINSTNVSGNKIQMIMHDGTVLSSDIARANTKIIGGIPKLQGYYYIPVRAVTDDVIIIGSAAFIVSLEPDCIGVNQLPINITVHGDSFQSGYNIFIMWPGGQLQQLPSNQVYIEGPYILKFLAENNFFFSNPNPPSFQIYVQDLNGGFSNELEFDVMPSINQC